jgi:hypothetical protein
MLKSFARVLTWTLALAPIAVVLGYWVVGVSRAGW